jgi:glycosyltransferase involved in cell wall biosynthesis
VCTGPTAGRSDTITYHQVHPSPWKPLTLLRQFLLALRLALAREYDLVASFALVPYGLFALVVGGLTQSPVHLGIIGSDLDVHARAWYGPVVAWLFRRFDVVTIAGSEYRERLRRLGVPRERIFTILHPVNSDFSDASRFADPEYDVLWLTRMSEEKAPLLFVEALEVMRDRGVEYSVAIVGSGPLESEVRAAVERAGLADRVDVPGWAEEPVEYYRTAGVYVLTSEREMLPLTLVESMLVGVPPVAPAVGAIPDVVEDGENGVLVADRSPETYADAIETLLTDEDTYRRVASNASTVESELSYDAVAESWDEIFDYV